MNKKSLVKNAADPRQVKAAKKIEVFKREDELKDLKAILSNDAGIRFVTRYLNKCGIFSSSFTGNSETFFKEGERNIGLKLLSDIEEADVTAIVKIFKIKGEL